MPLDLSTSTSLAARQTIVHCDRLPAGQQYLSLRRPEIGAFHCPRPCGGRCQFNQPARYTPVRLRRVACHLQLQQTLERLLEAAMQAEPAPACDLGPPELLKAACGVLHVN